MGFGYLAVNTTRWVYIVLKLRRQTVAQYKDQRFKFVRARILVQVTIYRRLLIGRDGHLDQSEAYDIKMK